VVVGKKPANKIGRLSIGEGFNFSLANFMFRLRESEKKLLILGSTPIKLVLFTRFCLQNLGV